MPSGQQGSPRIAVALSGGGHRACLYGLGLLMYLADAGLLKQVDSIASVSGGSLANGAIANDIDVRTASAADLEAVAGRVAHRIAHRGSVFGWWPTGLYIVLVLALGTLVFTGPWEVPVPLAAQLLLFAGGVLFFFLILALRGRVAGVAFARTVLSPGRRPVALADIHGGVDHIFCATDLHAGENVYFAKNFVRSFRFGTGTPNRLPLHRAVQASAAFPGAFPVCWMRTKPFAFVEPGEPDAANARFLALADGGVYDNMADQWALDDRSVDQLIVASGSAGLDWKPLRNLRIPILGEFLALMRDKSILYDNGNSLRRQELVARFQRADKEGKGLAGALVHITQSPFSIPDAYARSQRGPKAQRAHAVIAALEAAPLSRDEWRAIAELNAATKTTLLGFSEPVTARIMFHAYVLTMVNLHVLLGHPLLPLPDQERFARLARGHDAVT